ncbi:radical SAM family heme chaperone HemW [Algoriphagus namhaensis]|uniref:Heme chaperone HemW n=1 Tax=Algoriphagus namhaensis TaxID=915353 RepID=A0ABV8AQK4_9BACT
MRYICKIKEIHLAGIYIHIPFCKQACHYCDFHFSTQLSGAESMVIAICKELELRKNYLAGQTIETVYFGGGSPSILSPQQIDLILASIVKHYNCQWKEVTLEANPDDLNTENLSSWKAMGIDRLSLGIQSFQPELLAFYNRAHTAEESLQAIDLARNAGFDKFNLDLIYGFPSKTHRQWEEDLSSALAMNPGHLSCYALTVEPKTALGNWTAKGKFEEPSEDFVAEEFEILQSMTEAKGYVQYEISNFALEGKFSLHNSNYWKQIPYLGVGPSAHSFDGKDRGANPRNNIHYVKAIQDNRIPFEIDPLTPSEKLNEYLLTSLRTIWGADLDFVRDTFGVDIGKEKSAVLEQMKQMGWLIWKENSLSLSKSGKLLADSIAASLFID